MAIGLGSAALNVFFRDVTPLVKLGLQLGFYAPLIIYPVTAVPEPLRQYYFLNPMAGLIESYRDVLMEGVRPGTYLQMSAAISLLILSLGYFVFRRLESKFAEVIWG